MTTKHPQKIIVVMPAYNAAKTLEMTIRDIPQGSVDEIILVDDASSDNTVSLAKSLGITVHQLPTNMGYGANQKRCYSEAMKKGGEIIIMIHPDYQYDARLIPQAVSFIEQGICDVVMGCRVRSRAEALASGMPVYKYVANRFLTFIENIILGQNLGDFHSGFRAYSKEVLEQVPFMENSNDFVFDSEFLAQAAYLRFKIGDIPIPCRYFAEASSINFQRSVQYGLQTLAVQGKFLLQQFTPLRFRLFQTSNEK